MTLIKLDTVTVSLTLVLKETLATDKAMEQ
jgi:hypothetical protein